MFSATSSSHLGGARNVGVRLGLSLDDEDELISPIDSPWREIARFFVGGESLQDIRVMRKYLQFVTLLRVGVPALMWAGALGLGYPSFSLILADAINDADVFNVVANDYSQYIQNILTTSGLTFSLLVGNTYYFLYQQQEGTS